MQASVGAYYSRKVARHGATPAGVDWPCAASQELRFAQLLRVCDLALPFSLNDVGCGYGALVGYLAREHPQASVDYLGIDLAGSMIAQARRQWPRRRGVRFAVGCRAGRIADYSLASGIFNVKLDQQRAWWERFVAETLGEMHACSRLGFAVNFMARAAPGEPVEPALYRVAPARWMRYCERTFGASVERIDGYGLGEFTLLVRPAPAPQNAARAPAPARATVRRSPRPRAG